MQAPILVDKPLWNYHRRLLLFGPGKANGLVPACAASAAVGATIATVINSGGDVRSVAELIAPLLAAFLVVFGLEPELRSGNLCMLGCHSGFIRRVVLPRAMSGMVAALLVVWLTLLTLSSMVPTMDIVPALLAAVPSVWALSLLALTAAMVFRSPLSGLVVAAGLWGLNVVGGYGIHPLLGLQGYHAADDLQQLSKLWLLGKVTLLATGVLLLFCQRRWLLGRRALLRAEPVTVGLVLLLAGGAYMVSGAFTVVSYAYLARSSGEIASSNWLRRQMQPFQKVGIPALFGPAFQTYLSVPPEGLTLAGTRDSRKRRLDAAIARWPHSIWAENMALEAAEQVEPSDRAEAGRLYLEFADTHPHSPLVKPALFRIIRSETASLGARSMQPGRAFPGSPAAFEAARRLIEAYPGSLEARRASEYLETHY